MAPTDSKSEQATVQVNVDELRDSKDAILVRLMTLQGYIADLSKAYLEHANNVINGGSATIDLPAVPTGLSLGNLDRPSSPAKSEAGTKKRKRAPVDPNAPKRALTPYFLYMQSNRSKIAADLGETAKPKDVADEGTRRWQEMPASAKEVWKELYSQNYEKYKVNMAAYKAGKLEDEQDPAATQLQADFADVPKEASENESSSSEDEEEDNDEESRESSPSPVQPPPKEKTPRSTKRRRGSDAKKEVPEVPESAVKQTSPVKRGSRSRKAEPAAKETPATGKSKAKKRKSEV